MEKIIGVVGYESEDIIIYLAKLMTELGQKVAVVDRTEQEMLLEILDFCQENENAVREGEFSGIWITDQSVDYDRYDLVFYLFGYRLIHPKLYECESLIMVTDGAPAHASMLHKIGKWERKQYLLLRNLVPMKHSRQYLAMLAAAGENYCELPYDEQDIRQKYSLGFCTGCFVRGVSEGMKRVLEELALFLNPDIPRKRIREIMKKI